MIGLDTNVLVRYFAQDDPDQTAKALHLIDRTLSEYLLALQTMVVQNQQQVFKAAMALRSGTGSFPDALVGALGEWTGCTATVTFDRKAARMGNFQLL